MERLHRQYNRFYFSKIIYILIFSSIFTVFLFKNSNCSNVAYASPNSGCILINSDSMEVLYGENENIRLPMASTTKIMTALIAIENCNPNEIVTINKDMVNIEGSSVYLKENEQLTIEELLYCLMLRSGNDSAMAIAIHIAGNAQNFAEMMNIRAQSLKLKNTHFVNPHGLHDNNHYTSCYDLGIISCQAMKYPLFKKIVSTECIRIGKDESTRVLVNKNKMLKSFTGANGIKTGFTKKAGRCLVASANKNGVNLISIVLNRADMYNECAHLLNKGFDIIGEKNT